MRCLIGADEVGYGCWAGPICVAAVRAPENWHLLGLADSKKLSAKKREILSQQLWKMHRSGDIFIEVAMGSPKEIDTEGVANVQRRLFIKTINACAVDDAEAIVDGTLVLNKAALKVPYRSIVKADDKISTVMAASIVAKVHRDQYMYLQNDEYPQYDFAHNVGYGTKKHQEALKQYGATPLHRMSYKPLQGIL